jgi:hypothetical protein
MKEMREWLEKELQKFREEYEVNEADNSQLKHQTRQYLLGKKHILTDAIRAIDLFESTNIK